MRAWFKHWRGRLAYVAVGAIAGAIAVDAYRGAKPVLARLATMSGLVSILPESVSVNVIPIRRESGFHGLLWVFGHRDYMTTFQVVITNYSEPGGQRVPLQLSTRGGHLALVTCPPIARSTGIGGSQLGNWEDFEHSKAMKTIGIEIDLPAPASTITLVTSVIAQNGFIDDSDLNAHLMLPTGLHSGVAQEVTWTQEVR
jgi:hypothetical protein